jgi:hypothetical protein
LNSGQIHVRVFSNPFVLSYFTEFSKKFVSTVVHRSRSYLGPSETAQHLFEGLRLDLDISGERVIELADSALLLGAGLLLGRSVIRRAL